MIEDLWYKNAVVYSLDLDSFMDGNGDGTGDFAGLVRRLDYLETLGVDVIWLAPFQPSPNRDNGYDIADYYGVDRRHGSSGDFVEFVHQAKTRGIKVIMDLVVNHTSVDHPWFQEARANPESDYREWYVWSEERPESWDTGMVFPGVQEQTWTKDEKANEYYFHRFYSHQPDLNLDNPAVRTEIRRIMGYWLELGVSGFRVDAVPFLIEKPPRSPGDERKLHFEYLQEMRTFLQWRKGDAILLGEANVEPGETAPYWANGRGIQMMFNFWVNQHLFHSLATGEIASLVDALEATRELPPTAQWAQFLRNHDELDLGRLSEEQREAVFARFGPDPSMQLYHRGIRRRLAPMLGGRDQSRLAYSLLFSLPGTPVIRYGDEIGMGERLDLDEREAVRTPMQWTPRSQAGFSTARQLVHPLVEEGPYSFHHVNVEAQRRDSSSLLQWMAMMIRLRKECPEIGWGTFQVIDTGSPHVLALLFEWRGSRVCTLHNLDGTRHEIALHLDVRGGEVLRDLMSATDSRADADGRHRIALDAYGYRWYRPGEIDYALERAEEAPSDTAGAPHPRKPRRGRRE